MNQNLFYIETYGCTSNKADSLIISQILKNNGFRESTFEDATFIIINTCAVKQQTENKIKARLKLLYNQYKHEKGKYFIIAGCLPHIDSNYIKVIKHLIPNYAAILDLDNFELLPSILKRILSGERNINIQKEKATDKAEILINYPGNKITGILPISEGCLGACTYCCVKNARGKLVCYNPENIITNAESQLKQGIKQIYLTSQDCSTYRFNTITLDELVSKINDLDYQFFLRIGMLNPRFLIDHFGQIKKIYSLNKVYNFLHVPIQSGSDHVLKLMNRPYKIADLKQKLDLLRKQFPTLTISTDIITGFPGESEEDFKKSYELIEWLQPEILNISKFTIRPGTAAKHMKQLDSHIIKTRSIILSKLFRTYLKDLNRGWVGWEGMMLALHKGNMANQAFGRNYAYKNIFIDDYTGDFGKFIPVKIVKVDGFNLFAHVIEGSGPVPSSQRVKLK